ncbi:MAG: hypothetical protein HY553_21790 [Elusimicrobia bacterium]|nr:hypothetical protein [Elusimicrobiota bacterium]
MLPALAAFLAWQAWAQEFPDPSLFERLGGVRESALAYVRKVAARPSRRATGIRVQGRLPRFEADPARHHRRAPGEPAWVEGPLDRPSVYLGASGPGLEIDAGLCWDHVYLPGRSGFAFRPFWRVDDERGNRWENPRKGSRENVYFEPGEAVTMTFQRAGPGRFRLDIRAEAEPSRHFTVFIAARAPTGALSFKRVNAIDQRGNEGRDAAATRASASGARWDSTTLLGPQGVYGPQTAIAPAESFDIAAQVK